MTLSATSENSWGVVRLIANLPFCRRGSAFTHVTACMLAKSLSSFVASAAALIATGWSEPVPGGVNSRCGPPPFTAHPVSRLTRQLKSCTDHKRFTG